MTGDGLRRQLAELIATATDGDVPASVALAGDAPLSALGLTSLAILRVVDQVELRYGVELDPADADALASVDALAARLAGAGGGIPVDGG